MESPPYILCKNHNKNMVSCQSILGKFTKLGSWKSQRRGWVASPVGIWSGLKISGKSIAFRRTPPGRAQRTGSTGV